MGELLALAESHLSSLIRSKSASHGSGHARAQVQGLCLALQGLTDVLLQSIVVNGQNLCDLLADLATVGWMVDLDTRNTNRVLYNNAHLG